MSLITHVSAIRVQGRRGVGGGRWHGRAGAGADIRADHELTGLPPAARLRARRHRHVLASRYPGARPGIFIARRRVCAYGERVVDPAFVERRLAGLYDPLDPDRGDLDVYAAMAAQFGARSVVDIGCGTGTFACLLVGRGLAVTAADPAAASLDIARGKPGADRVRWILGYATDLPPLQADLATMTGNAAQEIVDDQDWTSTLEATHTALRPGGRLVFETRDPAARAWLEWNHEQSYLRTVIPGIGGVQRWFEVTGVSDDLVRFRGTYIFESDGLRLTPESVLRFRTRDEVSASLAAAGYLLEEVRQAPDRPGREMVFIARRPD